ncbi:MAG: hypothetical protein ACI83W_001723 [Marinoscillum sp.]|jgi:hypothetical protein
MGRFQQTEQRRLLIELESLPLIMHLYRLYYFILAKSDDLCNFQSQIYTYILYLNLIINESFDQEPFKDLP